MEVHHHAHTSRKKWTHYFWEFLMLFLAVFCGFLAENIREHKVEKQRGMQFLRSYYEDLKTDTATFEWFIRYYKNKIKILGSRGECFDSIAHNFKSTECFTALFENSTNFPDMVNTDRTMQQLKNSGGLRLLNAVDADSILLYDNMLKQYIRAETSSFQETQTAIRSTLYSLIDYQRSKLGATGTIWLIPDHRDLLNRYFNQLEAYSRYCNDNLFDLLALKSKAETSILYFKNKYGLK